jgi:putative ABC transport system ATP-binding protein
MGVIREVSRCADGLDDRLVSIRGLSKSYRSTAGIQYVLRDMTLQVRGGEFVVILGVSGSGKTTLLNLIGGMDQPESGELLVCGMHLEQVTESRLACFRRDSIGFVFQSYNLLPTLTARENIEAGLEVTGRFSPKQCRELALTNLAAVGLTPKADSLPEQLSGGEQQRVAVARALAKRPPLVLADEPTGNLDRDTGLDIWSLMHRLNRETGAAFLVVTHDPTAALEADRVFRIEQGYLRAVLPGHEVPRAALDVA